MRSVEPSACKVVHWTAPSASDSVADRPARPGQNVSAMPRVLIIQDDPAVLALMRHGLVRRGYEVDSVRSAHEAMDRLKTERPDLVVSDVHLEDARGDLLLGAVEAHFPD